MPAQKDPVRVFGENLHTLRKEKRLTAGDLADKLGISVKSLDAYERGTRKPSLSILDDLQQEFGVEAWRWLIPGGSSDEVQGHLPSTANEPSLLSLLFRKAERWSEDVERLSAAIPPEDVSFHLDRLASQGFRPRMREGIEDLVRVAEMNGLVIANMVLPWDEAHRAAALSAECTEPDRLFVNQNAPGNAQREDMGQCLVAHLLGLRPQACRTWANSETEVTVWHSTGRDMFGYSLDPEEWKRLRIDTFALNPNKGANACIAKKVVQAKITDSPTDEQKRISEHTDWPITRVERLYHKNGNDSFIAGITIDDTKGEEKTRLMVTVTDLQVPSLILRLTRELLVPTTSLRALLLVGGASIPVLAKYACVRQETIRQRLADTGFWYLIYSGQEMSRQPRDKTEALKE